MRPTREGDRRQGVAFSGLGFTPTAPTGDVEDPVDLATDEDARAWYPVSGSGSTTLVQSKVTTPGPGASVNQSVSFDAAVTAGSLLVVTITTRSTNGPFSGPAGWASPGTVDANGFNGGSGALFYKVADGTEGTGPFTFNTASGTQRRIMMAEFSGEANAFVDSAGVDSHGATTALAIGDVTPTPGEDALLIAFALNGATITAINTGYTSVAGGFVEGGVNGPYSRLAYKAVSAASGDYGATTAQTSGNECAGDHLAFSAATEPIWVPAPFAVDSDDATYHEVTGHTECLRVQLTDTYQLGRARLVIGPATAGSKTYSLEGQTLDDIDADTGTEVGEFVFTAAGAYAAADVTITISGADGYEFYRLVGPDETRRIFALELYPPTTLTSADLDAHLADTVDAHDASAVSYANTSSGLAAGNVQAAIDELVVVGTISPSQLTANTDNWNPTGLATADVIRLSTDASRNITGIVAPSISRRLILQNVGSFAAVLVHDATSTAANRFVCPSSTNMTLAANASVELVYDETSDRWRVLDPASGGGALDYGETADIVTQAYSDAADAGSSDEVARADHRHGMPASGGGGTVGALVKDYDSHKRSSGDVTCSADQIWADVDTGLDCVVDATAGDRILVGTSILAVTTDAVGLMFTGMTIVSGSPVNDIATDTSPSNTTFGVGGWFISASVTGKAAGSVMYTVQSGDISAGTVTVRLRYRTTNNTNRIIEADTDHPIHFWVENIGASGTISGIAVSSTPSLSSEGQAGFDTDDEVLYIHDGQRARAVSEVGWAPGVLPTIINPTVAGTISSLAVAANGGTLLVPMRVPGHMLLESVSISQQSSSLARTWGWDLYIQDLNNGNSGENTLRRVANSAADDSFTPSGASIRTSTAASAPVYLAPGIYWLAIQCRHATNALGVGYLASSSSVVNTAQTKTTTNPNGATLDAVAATWTAKVDNYIVALKGRVFGQTTAF